MGILTDLFYGLHFNIAEMDLRTFGLQQDGPFADFRLATFVDQLAVNDQLDGITLASDFILVPFTDFFFDVVLHAEDMPILSRGFGIFSLWIHFQLEVTN